MAACDWTVKTESKKKKLPLNLSTTATLATEESMYGLYAKKNGHCGEVAFSGGSTVLRDFFLLVLWRKLQEFIRYFLCARNLEPKTLLFD